MSDQKLTPWFMNGEKPARKGVYEIEPDGDRWFSHWDGRSWGWMSLSVKGAYMDRGHISHTLGVIGKWRGLAHPPKTAP